MFSENIIDEVCKLHVCLYSSHASYNTNILHLITIKFNLKYNKLAFQVVIVGNGAVGKSSMIQKYCRNIFTSEYKKTIGVDFLEKRIWLV